MATLLAATKPQVSARAHNRVLDAAQERVDRLEPRLAAVIEEILGRAGARAATLFHERATRHVVPDASLVAAAANSDVAKTSTMIALKPRSDEAAALAEAGGDPPEILHVTLAYLGDTDQPLREIADALMPVAATYAPLSGVVGGVGMFHPAGVGIILPDVRGLTETRQAVVQALHDAGIDYGRDHGFTPHITINGDGEPPDHSTAGLGLHFDSLHIVRGNDEEIELPLVGVRALTAAGPNWSPPFADELIDVDALVKQILAKTEPVRAALIEQTMTPALKQAGLSFDVSNPLTAKLFADTASQVTNIAMTTRANLMDIIGKSYQNGLTIPATRDLIRQGMRTASKTRATMIARTEMARAVNGGSLTATQLVSQETGQNYDKVWHTAPGARYPRHELYEDLDGQTVGMDETFNVGGDQLQYPGDPNGEPGETINCRCALSYTEVAAVRTAPAPITDEELDAADSPVLTTGLDPIPNTQAADKLASVLANRAKAAEEPVSAIMKQVFADSNARFAGFKYRLKGLSSTEQKLLDDARDKGITPREDAYQISDMLRYTATFEPDRYIAGVREVLTDLQDRGFTVDRVRNTWSKDVQYAGINTRIAAPNGYRFELQFHTPASFDLKQNIQHKLYEDYRKLDQASPEARALDAQMIQNVRKLDFPQGVEDFEWPEVAAPPTAPASAVQSIDIGVTPFRAGEDDAVGFYSSTKYRQFIADVNQSAEAYGVHIDSIEKATGVWEGDTEPSVSIHVSPISPTPESEVYKGQHSAPGPDYGAPMYDLSGEHSGAQIYPSDVYDEKNQVHLYGQGGDAADRAMDQETFNTINAVKGDPSAMVTVYRAVPGDVTAINPGDWVTPSKTYAEHHAEANLGADADGHVVSMQVPAGQLWTDGNSIQEWGWNPPHFEDFNAEARARAFGANLGRAYNQDGVLLFAPGEAAPRVANFVIDSGVKGDVVQEARSARDDIGRVVKIPSDVKIVALPDSDMATARLLSDGSIGVQPTATANDIVHEYGHYVDSHLLGEKVDTSGANIPDSLYQVMKNSPTMQAVRNDEFEVLKGDTQLRNQLLQGREMFARAFDQYVAEETGDPALMGRVDKLLADKLLHFQYWPHDEFKPIKDEITRVMESRDLLFEPTGTGDSMMATFRESLPEGKVTAAMDKAGILGGRFTTDGRLQVIGPRTPEFTAQISQLSKELGGITLDTGEPMPLYTAMTSYTGPGSRYFSDVAGFVGDGLIKTPDQIRTIFQGFALDVSEALDVPVDDVTDHVQMELQKAFKDATRASIEKRDLTQEVTVYGEKPAPGEVQSFFLKPGPGLQPYTVDRDNILVDMDAFRPETASATNEVLISGEKIKPGAVEGGVVNTGAYDVARGDFIMMERDEGDYQKALDALTHPKGVTVENVPTAEPPPPATVRRGDPIVAHSASEMDDLINAPAQKEWLDNLASQDAEAQQEGVSTVADSGPIGTIMQYTQYGSADINDLLAGRTPDLQQFNSTEDVEAAAAKMGQIVDSAPPLPTGTTLYRAVSPTGIDPSLGQQFRDIEKDAMSKPGVGVTPVSELSDRLSGFTVSYSEPPLPTLAIQKQTMTVANGAGDPIGTVSFETRKTPGLVEGTLEPGRQVYVNKITLAKPKADLPGDYYRKALAARVYVDQDFKPLVWDDFETLDDAKFGVEMAVQNPSWNLLRVATDNGTPRFWRPSDGPISTDALAFANLDGSARTALKPFMDDLFANRANPTLNILNGQTKALGDWATQRYPTGSYVAMGEPGEFESMTTNPHFASNFKNPNSPGLVFRVVNAKTGAPIWPYSALPNEREILAPPGTMYRVRNVEVRPMEGTPGTSSLTGSDLIDRVVVTLEEAPPCGPVRASLVAATGVACTNIAQYVPSGDKPATVGNSTLFPGQPRAIAEDAAAHRETAIAQFARDNNMSVADYKAAATEAIRSYIDQNPQVRIRLTHQSLEQVLEDGRLKNEFELPGVTPEMTDVRVRVERNLFGIKADANPASRPIYGYLAGTADESGIVQEYGDMIVNLNPTVNSRATFTIGDSYRAALNHDLSPSLLSDPGIGSWDGSFDIVKAFREGDIGKISRYVEVEIHGGVPVSDIGGITPDEALIVSREDAERVKDAAEAVTELAANYEGTQQTSPQVDEAGLPLDKPAGFDVYASLTEIAKNAALRQGALAALIARVGLKGSIADSFVDFSVLGDLAEGTP